MRLSDRERKTWGLPAIPQPTTCRYLVGGECIDRLDVAYIIGLEARGLSPQCAARGREWKNQAHGVDQRDTVMADQGRGNGPLFPAGAQYHGHRHLQVQRGEGDVCPFTGQKYVAHPALYPDFAAIHVHECDVYGNAHVYGASVSDQDLAKASKRVVLTTERIISNDKIRQNPEATFIPFWCVDAVIEVPYGSYPGNMPYEYFSDEEISEKMAQPGKGSRGIQEIFSRNRSSIQRIFMNTLILNGGIERMIKLRAIEHLTDKK